MRATIEGQALESESSRFRPLSVRPHGGLLQNRSLQFAGEVWQ
jgi:hypothetical protein